MNFELYFIKGGTVPYNIIEALVFEEDTSIKKYIMSQEEIEDISQSLINACPFKVEKYVDEEYPEFISLYFTSFQIHINPCFLHISIPLYEINYTIKKREEINSLLKIIFLKENTTYNPQTGEIYNETFDIIDVFPKTNKNNIQTSLNLSKFDKIKIVLGAIVFIIMIWYIVNIF